MTNQSDSWLNLSGRVALVTGGAQGIGRAICGALGKAGAVVLVTDRDAQGAQAAAAEIVEAGGTAHARGLDVTVDADWEAAEAWVRAEFGRLDVLVNNAGICLFDRVGDDALDTYRKIFAVNVEGALLGMRTALRIMRETGTPGSIINLSSVAAKSGAPRMASYGASKSAVEHYTRSAALENAQLGFDIRINSVHPGMIETDMADQVYDHYGDREKLIPQMTTGRNGSPEEIADLVTFLASDRSSFVSGSAIVIDRAKTA